MGKRDILVKFIIMSIVIFSLISCVPKNNTILQSSIIIEPSSKQDISGKGDLWADRKLKVGLVGPGAEGDWRGAIIKNIKKASEEWNVNLLFKDGQAQQNVQAEHMNNFIDENVDAIGLIPVWESGWEDILKEVKQANIPIILLDRSVDCADESLWTSHIVNDWYKEAKMAGEWLIEYLEKQGKLDEEIKIAELSGPEDTRGAQDEGSGFREAIKEFPNIDIVISKNGDFIQAKGYEEMVNILSETTDIDVLYCHNDDMALGAIQAIEEAGLVPGKDILIISVDGSDKILEYIAEGKIACSVETNPLMGDLFMEACIRLANGEEIEREIHPVDRVFDVTNAQAEIDYRKLKGYGY